MTPEEFKARRQRLGYTQRELAEILGVSERAVTYKEAGDRAITRRDVVMLERLKRKKVTR